MRHRLAETRGILWVFLRVCAGSSGIPCGSVWGRAGMLVELCGVVWDCEVGTCGGGIFVGTCAIARECWWVSAGLCGVSRGALRTCAGSSRGNSRDCAGFSVELCGSERDPSRKCAELCGPLGADPKCRAGFLWSCAGFSEGAAGAVRACAELTGLSFRVVRDGFVGLCNAV